MKPLEYRFSLNMNDETAQVFCNVRNGDDCSKLIVSLQEDGRAYTFDDDVHAYFLAKKSDGNSLYTECSVENNTIIYEFTEQTAPVSGTVVCQFLLLSGSNRLTTPIFRLEVFDNVSIDPDSPQSLPEYTALIDATQEAIDATDDMRDLIEEIEYKLEHGELKGDKGDKGDQGNPGADGFSPTATVTKSGHTATITITDKNGTTTVPIYDGDANKMDLAPLNPTAEQIAAMPSGQVYDDVTKKIVTIKGGTELSGVINSSRDPEYAVPIGSLGQLLRYGQLFYICDGNNWKPLSVADSNVIRARATLTDPDGNYTITSSVALQVVWELFTKFHCVKISLTDQYGRDVGRTCLILRVTGNNHEHLSAILLPTSTDWSNGFAYNRVHFLEQHAEGSSDTLRLETKYVYPPREQYYTKTEIDSMIPTVPTNISAFTNDSGYLTLGTLPIYDGTVI